MELHSLKITSCMSQSADSICDDIARYVGEKLGWPTEFISDIPWQERERLFDAGEIQICWICGLPYVQKLDRGASPIELLAVPVMVGERYQNQPVYFSDVVVRRDSPFRTFSDLRGASWAYNEPRSHSGYNVVRHQLARRGERSGFFGRVAETGAHQKSLELILRRQVDASAIDSTVLEWALSRFPEIVPQISVIETFGPSPIPPFVVSTALPEQVRDFLRRLFLDMQNDPQGRAILRRGGIARFVEAKAQAYDQIRQMTKQAEAARL